MSFPNRLISIVEKTLGGDIIDISQGTLTTSCGCKAPTPASNATLDVLYSGVNPISRHYSRGNYQSSLPSTPSYSCREDLRHHVTQWASRPCQSKTNEPGMPSFSTAFNASGGMGNITNICGLDDEHRKLAFFSAMLEREAFRQFQSGSNQSLQALLHINERDRGGIVVSGGISPRGGLFWSINYGQRIEDHWWELVQQIFNLSKLDAIATLAHILGLRFEDIFQLSSNRHAAEVNGLASHSVDVPEHLYLQGLPPGSACAELLSSDPIYGNAGQTIGAILWYQLGNQTFCIPATVGNGTLCIGKYKPTAYFLNQHIMDRYDRAVILLCQDMRTAIALQKQLDKVIGYTPAECIVSAHLGDDLSVLPLNFFYNHDVVFVPAPSIPCMAKLKTYNDYLGERGGQAKSFRVYPGFLLHSLPGCELSSKIEGLSTVEAELLGNCRYLKQENQPVSLVEQVIRCAVPYGKFIKWGQESGLFKQPKTVNASPAVPPVSELPPVDPALMPDIAYNMPDVTLYHILRPGNLVMILGAKGAGKTQCSLSSCHALLAGNIPWPFFAGCLNDVGNIAYVDAETPYDEFCANMKQHHLDTEVGKRFFGLSKFAPEFPEFCNGFSLTDQSFRDGLHKYLLEHQCRVVFLDNLTALMGDAVHQGKSAQDVLDWAQELQKIGLCVVLVHHKSEIEPASFNSGKARGSQMFAIRARTIIALLSSSEILENDLGTPAVREAAKQAGLTVGIRYNASKPAPVLEKRTFWLHLPLGASGWKFLAATGVDGEEMPFELQQNGGPAEPEVASESPLPSSDDGREFSPDERRLLELLRNGSAKREDLQKELGFGEDKTRDLLRGLIEHGAVVKEGQGRSTYYVLVSKGESL